MPGRSDFNEVVIMIKLQALSCTPAFRGRLLLLALMTGPITATPVSASPYTIVDLGPDLAPTDINIQGTVVGAHTTGTGSTGFRWTASNGLEDIPGTVNANAVNDSDQIVGNTASGAYLYDDALHAWDGYGAYGINAAGVISGYKVLDNPYRSSPLPLDPAIRSDNTWKNFGIATVYARGRQQGVYADLYQLRSINSAGYAVGRKQRSGLVGSSSILVGPTIPGVAFLPIPYGGYAAAINNQNRIVGATGNNSSTGTYAHAYLYDLNASSFQDLGTLNKGLSSFAADINEMNQVVGSAWMVTQLTSVSDPTQYHAFMWENGVMTDLNSQLPAGPGWLLTAATAISDSGDIVGTGLLHGQPHGFLLTTGQTTLPPGMAPVAVAGASVTSGKAPLKVRFSAKGSYDPDGGTLTYRWDFGDGSPVRFGANRAHTYSKAGIYTVVLTVTDRQNLRDSAQLTITVK